MYDRILVVIRDVEHSESVLEKAATLAAEHDAGLVLLKVLPVPEPVVERTEVVDEFPFLSGFSKTDAPLVHVENRVISTVDDEEQRLRLEAKERLDSWKTQLETKGIPTRIAVRFGDPAEEIANLAKRYRFDLILLPRRARSGLARLLRRTGVAEKVFRKVNTPVLAMSAA